MERKKGSSDVGVDLRENALVGEKLLVLEDERVLHGYLLSRTRIKTFDPCGPFHEAQKGTPPALAR